MTKAPHGLGLPWKLAQPDRDIWNLVHLTGHQVRHSKCTFQMMETRENISDGHKAKPLGHRTKLKKKISFIFYVKTQESFLNRLQSKENCLTT